MLSALGTRTADHCKISPSHAHWSVDWFRFPDSESKRIFFIAVFSTNCHICDGNPSSFFVLVGQNNGDVIRKLVRPLWLCKLHLARGNYTYPEIKAVDTFYFFQPGFIGPVLRVEISQEVAHNDTCLSLGQEHNWKYTPGGSDYQATANSIQWLIQDRVGPWFA